MFCSEKMNQRFDPHKSTDETIILSRSSMVRFKISFFYASTRYKISYSYDRSYDTHDQSDDDVVIAEVSLFY